MLELGLFLGPGEKRGRWGPLLPGGSALRTLMADTPAHTRCCDPRPRRPRRQGPFMQVFWQLKETSYPAFSKYFSALTVSRVVFFTFSILDVSGARLSGVDFQVCVLPPMGGGRAHGSFQSLPFLPGNGWPSTERT